MGHFLPEALIPLLVDEIAGHCLDAEDAARSRGAARRRRLAMKRLSLLDALFLYMETPETPMHVAVHGRAGIIDQRFHHSIVLHKPATSRQQAQHIVRNILGGGIQCGFAVGNLGRMRHGSGDDFVRVPNEQRPRLQIARKRRLDLLHHRHTTDLLNQRQPFTLGEFVIAFGDFGWSLHGPTRDVLDVLTGHHPVQNLESGLVGNKLRGGLLRGLGSGLLVAVNFEGSWLLWNRGRQRRRRFGSRLRSDHLSSVGRKGRVGKQGFC